MSALQNVIQRMYKKLALPLTAETISNMSQAVVAEVAAEDKMDSRFTQNTFEHIFWNSVLNAVDKETMDGIIDAILQGLDLDDDYDEFAETLSLMTIG